MRLPLLLSLSLLLCVAQKICAQLAPADDFFHSGAQFYLSNNVPSALERVETGLKLYPEDEKLKKLEHLLKQQQQQNQQQQNQQDQQQQNNQQQKSDEQKNQERNQPQQSPEQQKPEDQKKADQKKDEPPKQPEQPKPSPEKKDGGKPEEKNAEGQPVAPGQMTPEEAKRLLDTQKGNEPVLQLKPQGKPQDRRKPLKDW